MSQDKQSAIEAAARAMCQNHHMPADDLVRTPDGQSVPYWTEFEGDARAAILALRQWLADQKLVVVPREATSHMCTHASLVEVDDIELTPSEYRAAWQAMISAAPDALETKP